MSDDDLSPDYSGMDKELEEMLYARHAEIKSFEDLKATRGTPIPALFNLFYKFIQNPSTVSVETFKRMVDTDDTIGSGVDFLTTVLASRIGGYQHKNEEVTEFVNEALTKIKGGWFNAIKEMLSATWAGFSVQEKVWANTDLGFIIERLITLPPSTILFEVDRSGELTQDGVLQYQRNLNPALLGGGGLFGTGFATAAFPVPGRQDPYARLGDYPFPIRVANTFQYLSIRIPVEKCVHYSFDAQGKFGNPYGRSLLRRAYKYYVMKDAFLQMLSIALDRKGTPLMVVYANPNYTVVDQDKAVAGTTNRGKDVGMRADRAALRAFTEIHNDSVIVLPGKKDEHFTVEPVRVDGNPDVFITAIEMCNKSILRSLLIPSLIFGNGDGSGSYSLGQEHSKTFDKLVDGINEGVIQTILKDIVTPLIKYNFPEEVWKKDGFGDFSKREFSQDEQDKILSSIEKAVNMGAVDMTDLADLNKVREVMGFAERKDAIVQEEEISGNMGDQGIGNAETTEESTDASAPKPSEIKKDKVEPKETNESLARKLMNKFLGK